MRDVVRYLLCMFVFTQPWDTIAWEGVGALSRVVGIVTLGAALLTVGVQRHVRRSNAIFWLAITFVASNAVSLLWTISTADSIQRIWTYTQLLGSVWMVQEFARTRKERESLLVAFCLGAFVPMASLLNSFRLGVNFGPSDDRFSSTGAFYNNANSVALILVIGIPMALYLIQHRRGIVRVGALIYVTLAPLTVVLTGTRSTILAGILALSIAPFTQLRQSLLSFLRLPVLFRATALLTVATALTILFVPQALWDRISTIPSEIIEGGGMSGRSDIWNAGTRAFLDRPLLGFGAATFGTAVTPFLGGYADPHNMPLEVLVEQGVVGFSIFVALLMASALAILRLPPPERKLWAALMVSWFVGVLAINFATSKATWLLFGLLAAQAAQEQDAAAALKSERRLADVAARRVRPQPVHRRHAAQISQTDSRLAR